MNVLIINQQNKFRIPKSFLLEILPLIFKILSKKNILIANENDIPNKKSRFVRNSKDLNLVFVNKKEIQALNYQFRGIDKPTDVLSFTSSDPYLFGELIFCPEIIVKQSGKNFWPQKYEYLYMLIHGLLHLMGFDHVTEEEAHHMFKIQDEVFNLVSSGPKVLNNPKTE